MGIECCCSSELQRTFRITGQGVYLSGKNKPLSGAFVGKPNMRSLRGMKYENALVT